MAGGDKILDIKIIPMYSASGSSKPVGVIIVKTIKR